MFLKRLSGSLAIKALAYAVPLIIFAALIWSLLLQPGPMDNQPLQRDNVNEHESLPPQESLEEPIRFEPQSGGPPSEAQRLSAALALLIRAETLPSEHLNQALGWLKTLQPQSQVETNLISGAEAFLSEDYQAAEAFFGAAWLVSSDDIHLPSFLAASALRADDAAKAETFYLKALVAKSAAGLGGVDLSADQLGLALSLIQSGRPEEARPLAEYAWTSRHRHLGEANPDTMSAANRLAVIYVALDRPEQAEDLLKEAYAAALPNAELTGQGLTEARLLLDILLAQSGQQMVEGGQVSTPPNGRITASSATAAHCPTQGVEPAEFDPPESIALETEKDGERLAQWRQTASALSGHNDALAADLRRHILRSRMKNEKIPPSHPDLRADLLAMAESYIASSRYEQAEAEIMILLMLTEDKSSQEFTDLAELMAQSLEGQNKFSEAEEWWHQAVEPVDGRLLAAKAAGRPPLKADVARSLDIHRQLGQLYVREGKVSQAAEIEFKSALARLDEAARETKEAAAIYFKLGLLLWLNGDDKSGADYLRRAQTLALALAGREDNEAEREAIRAIAGRAAEQLAAMAEKQNPPDFLDHPVNRPAGLPEADLLHLELSALKVIGRTADFEERLASVLDESARLYGPGDRRYMRYYNLKLKWLEEKGRVDELTAELKAQAQNPPGRTEAERLLNRCSAMIYAARVNEKAGRWAEAAALYQQALSLTEGRSEKAIVSRRAGAEAALKRLKFQAPAGAMRRPNDGS